MGSAPVSVGHEKAPAYAIEQGRELIYDGFECDVEVASQIDIDDVVPVLHGSAFVRATALDESAA